VRSMMKTGALAVLAMCAVAGLGQPAFASPNDSGAPNQSQTQSMRHGRRDKQFTRFSKKLNLTEDQQEKIRPIFEDQAEQFKAISSDKSVSKEDRQEKFRAIHSATEEKIEPLLTPDQMEKWGEWKQKQWDRAAERRQQKQDGSASQGKWHNHRRGSQEGNWQARFERFSKTLSLTEDQQEKIKPIFQDQAEQLKTVFNDQSLSQQDKQEKVKAIHAATQEKIEPFLSPDQMEKWSDWKQNGWDRDEERNEQKTDHTQGSNQTTDTR
jgi:Spy/CpxP family protein refolding chaperone